MTPVALPAVEDVTRLKQPGRAVAVTFVVPAAATDSTPPTIEPKVMEFDMFYP